MRSHGLALLYEALTLWAPSLLPNVPKTGTSQPGAAKPSHCACPFLPKEMTIKAVGEVGSPLPVYLLTIPGGAGGWEGGPAQRPQTPRSQTSLLPLGQAALTLVFPGCPGAASISSSCAGG